MNETKYETSDLAKRFMDVLKVKGYTGYRFAKEVPGILEGTITKIRTGRVQPSKIYTTALLEKFPELSKVWLLTGEGEMFQSEVSIDQKESYKEIFPNIREQTLHLISQLKPKDFEQEIDRIANQSITGYYYPEISASAGLEQNMDNTDLQTIPVTIPGWEKNVIFINVYGDSMSPIYESGQIIGIKEVEFKYINYGYAYVVVFNDGQVFLKYIKKGSDNKHVILASENEFYEPQEFEISLIKKVYIIKGAICKTTI